MGAARTVLGTDRDHATFGEVFRLIGEVADVAATPTATEKEDRAREGRIGILTRRAVAFEDEAFAWADFLE